MRRTTIVYLGFILACSIGAGCSSTPSTPENGNGNGTDTTDAEIRWLGFGEQLNLHTLPLTLLVEAVDDYVPATVRFVADGETIGELNAAPYSLVWDETGGATIGSHRIEAYGLDADGEVETDDIALDIYLHAADDRFGGAGADAAYAIEQLADGRIVMAGDIALDGGWSRGFLMGFDTAGEERWIRFYGDRESHFKGIATNSDGSMAVGGWIWSEPHRANSQEYLVKVSSNGIQEWESVFTVSGGKGERVQDFIKSNDGGYVLTGHSETFAGGFMMITKSNGNPQFSSGFGAGTFGYGMARISGGYVVTGLQEVDWGELLFLSRRESDGSEAWSRTFTAGGNFSVGRDIIAVDGGSYVVAGGTNSDLWLLKTDADGNELWSRTYGGPSWDLGLAVAADSDGGYIICGETVPGGAIEPDLWLLKTDAQGDTLWTRSFGGPGRDAGHAVLPRDGGGYMVAGVTETAAAGSTDAWLLTTDALGNAVANPALRSRTQGKVIAIQQAD